MKCSHCGADNPTGAFFCNDCGAPLNAEQPPPPPNAGVYPPPQAGYAPPYYVPTPQAFVPVSASSRWLAFALCLFLGAIGVHRFYVGKIGTGILYILTGGLFGIGWLVDLIMIACGSFTDAGNLPLKY